MTVIGQDTGDLSNAGHRLGNDTGTVNPLHIEQYGGAVESQFVKASIMREYFKLKRIVGTDTVTNDRIGKTTLQAVVPGTRPDSHAPTFDNISVKVDTVVLARSNVALLHDFQAHYDVRAEIGRDHGKEIGKFFDEAFLIQGIKAARVVVGTAAGETPAPEGFQSGNVITLTAAGDENDPDKLQRAIEDAAASIEKKDVDIESAVMFVPVDQYYVLLR
ncbi:MAG: capsid protein, partial [Desulfobulbaceae bacterium]|nr:capsid protein [Desulfobulbaceae bacterium]